MTSKISKKDLKSPDTFHSVSDKVFAWIEKHAQSIGALIGVVVVLSAGWVIYGYVQSHAETKAAEALYAPEAELKKAESSVREERAKEMQKLKGLDSKGKQDAKPESVRPADYAKDFQPIVDKIKVQIQQHSSTKAAMVAALNLSYFLWQQKQYPEALTVLSLPTYHPSSGDILNGFWLMHRGLILMENQKYEDAAKAYQTVLDQSGLKAFHPEALLKLGVAQEQKGEADKARQTYEKLGREYPDSEASSSAQQYLRLLDLKAKG